MERKAFRRVILVFLLCNLLMPSILAKGQDVGSLTIELIIQEPQGIKSISGAGFEIWKIGNIRPTGQADYELLEAYSSLGIDIEGLTSSKNKEVAERLLNHVPQPGIRATTNSQGKAVFNGLESGLYLICQYSSNASAANYNKAGPFLVSVPSYVDGVWVYDIITRPKTVLVEEKPEYPPGEDHDKPGPYPKKDPDKPQDIPNKDSNEWDDTPRDSQDTPIDSPKDNQDTPTDTPKDSQDTPIDKPIDTPVETPLDHPSPNKDENPKKIETRDDPLSKTPKTGDDFRLGAYLLLICLSLSGILIINRNKKDD